MRDPGMCALAGQHAGARLQSMINRLIRLHYLRREQPYFRAVMYGNLFAFVLFDLGQALSSLLQQSRPQHCSTRPKLHDRIIPIDRTT